MGYTIGQVVKKLRINKETVRYYEKIGLLKDIKKDRNGYRVYEDNNLETLQFILMVKEYDFTLKEIELLLEKVLPEFKGANQEEVECLIDDKIQKIDQKIQGLTMIKQVLVKVQTNVLKGKTSCYKDKDMEEILKL